MPGQAQRRERRTIPLSSGRKAGERKIGRDDHLPPHETRWKLTYACFLKASDYSWSYISDKTGIQQTLVREWLREPTSVRIIEKIQADIVSGTMQRAKDIMGWAWEELHEYARTESDRKLRLTAILEILDRGGLTKVNKSERTVHDGPSVVIDMEAAEKISALPLETQQELARLGDEMSNLMEQAKGEE